MRSYVVPWRFLCQDTPIPTQLHLIIFMLYVDAFLTLSATTTLYDSLYKVRRMKNLITNAKNSVRLLADSTATSAAVQGTSVATQENGLSLSSLNPVTAIESAVLAASDVFFSLCNTEYSAASIVAFDADIDGSTIEDLEKELEQLTYDRSSAYLSYAIVSPTIHALISVSIKMAIFPIL